MRAEEARIQLRQMDLDLAREQTKASARYERINHPVTAYVQTPQAQHHHHPPPPQSAYHPPQPQPQQQSQPQQSQPATTQYGPYYGLSPVQQQVLARFNHPVQHGNHPQPPPSPSVPYPHSAHPLCPPSNEDRSRLQQPFRQKSPSSPIGDDTSSTSNSKKRNRSSISSPNENVNESQPQPQDKLSHNKVMEALKAKIQRGNGGPPSPLTASPMRSINQQQSQENINKKRKPTLPRPVVIHQQIVEGSSPSPSPRSAKPVLPPIDTNLGRIDKTTTINRDQMIKADSSTSESSSTSSSSTTNKSNIPNEPIKQPQQQPQEATSPSDHILLNTRRARSLSPSSVAKKA